MWLSCKIAYCFDECCKTLYMHVGNSHWCVYQKANFLNANVHVLVACSSKAPMHWKMPSSRLKLTDYCWANPCQLLMISNGSCDSYSLSAVVTLCHGDLQLLPVSSHSSCDGVVLLLSEVSVVWWSNITGTPFWIQWFTSMLGVRRLVSGFLFDLSSYIIDKLVHCRLFSFIVETVFLQTVDVGGQGSCL